MTTWEGFDGYWVPLGWSKTGPILTQSRIDTPKTGARVSGRIPIAGVAWAPDRGIAKVEVAIDDVWQEARLSSPISDATWVQWVVEWDVTPGRAHDHGPCHGRDRRDADRPANATGTRWRPGLGLRPRSRDLTRTRHPVRARIGIESGHAQTTLSLRSA